MLLSLILGLIALATASPVSRDDVPAVTPQEYDLMKFYAQHASAAYCNYNAKVGSKVQCADCPELGHEDTTIVASKVGLLTGIGMYVSVDQRREEIVVAIRGSSNLRNFLTDAAFPYVPCPYGVGCLVHVGFDVAWKEVMDAIDEAVNTALQQNPNYDIVITGHSLGGAVATLVATHFRSNGCAVAEFTYGSPRVGNIIFAQYASSQNGTTYRVTHESDPVPRLPPLLLGYRHLSPEYWLHNGESTQNDYHISDIEKCNGYINLACNSGTLGLDIRAHSHYLVPMSSCGAGSDAATAAKFVGLSSQSLEVDDDNFADDEDDTALMDQLRYWAEKDKEYTAQLTM